MNLETRVQNLEKNLDALIKQINNTKFYTDADVNGVRKGTSDNSAEIQNTQESVTEANQVIDSVLAETVPELTTADEELKATVDTIMLEIIPDILDTINQ